MASDVSFGPMRRPLERVRVLDFSTLLPGPEDLIRDDYFTEPGLLHYVGSTPADMFPASFGGWGSVVPAWCQRRVSILRESCSSGGCG